MASLEYFAIIPKIVGSEYPISYNKVLQCVLCTYSKSYQLVRHDNLIFWKCWTTHFPKIMEVLTFYLQNPNTATNRLLSHVS